MEHDFLLIRELQVEILLKHGLFAGNSLSTTGPSSHCSNQIDIRVTDKVSRNCYFDFDVRQGELPADDIFASELHKDLPEKLSSAVRKFDDIFALD